MLDMRASSLSESFTSARQSQLSANIDITSNLPTDVPFTDAGAEPTLEKSNKETIKPSFPSG